MCDYRLASEDAVLGLPAVKECLIPSMRALPAAPPHRRRPGQGADPARRADRAREAERYGLVNRVVPAAEFAAALDATVERFLALPPASVRASKLLTARAFDLDHDAFRPQMQAHFKVCLDSDEHRRPWTPSGPAGEPEG